MLAITSSGLAAILLAVVPGIVPPDTDMPWHIAAGRELLRHWRSGSPSVSLHDPFSWTAAGVLWRSNSWLFDALMAVLYDSAGWAGIAVLRMVLLIALACLLWAFSRSCGAGVRGRAAALLLTAVLAVRFVPARPQLVSFVLLLVVMRQAIGLLSRSANEEAGKSRTSVHGLLLLAATVAVWTALHGAAIVGVAVCIAASVAAAARTRTWRWPALVAGVAAVASCVSPYGPRVWTYAFATGSASRLEGIAEWQPPSIHSWDDLVVFGVVVIALLATARLLWRRNLEVLGIVLLLLVSALTAVRNEAFLLIGAIPVTSVALDGLMASGSGRYALARTAIRGAAVASAAILTIGLLRSPLARLELLPTASAKALFPESAAHALPGGCLLLNEYGDGGFLMLERRDVLVSQDGRNDLYGATVLAAQRRLLSSSPESAQTPKLLGRPITCVLLRQDRPLASVLRHAPGWSLAAADRGEEAWVYG